MIQELTVEGEEQELTPECSPWTSAHTHNMPTLTRIHHEHMHTFAMNGTVAQEKEAERDSRRSETGMTGDREQCSLTWFPDTVTMSFQKYKEREDEDGQGVRRVSSSSSEKLQRKGSALSFFRC